VATFISNSAVETQKLGQRFAENLMPGDVVALTGELGSGKTQFVKGIACALGSKVPVTSPTFTLVHEYSDGRMPVYHFDFFRIENGRAAARLGLDDYFFGNGVSIVEWADRFAEFIPKNARWVSFESKSENERTIKTAT
jgi:tRNA threonylcarbamoyladenosine biosynthesis protein TsaE